METEAFEIASMFSSFLGGTGTPSEPVSAVDPGGEMGWDPDPQPQLETVMPDYGEPFYDPGRPYLPAKDPYSSGTFLTGGPAGMSADDKPAGFGPGPGFDPGLESEFQVVEPSLWEKGWDIWGSPEIAPLRDSLLNKYVLKPESETVNTQGQTETHVNPQYTSPRGSVPITSVPQSTVFFPWQQPGDIGDAPERPSFALSPGVLLIGGLALFLLTR